MSNNQSNNERIAKNTIFLTLRMFLVLGVSLYTSRVILSALGVEDFGIYNVVGGFVSMFSFLNTAMTTGIQRFYNFELGKNGTEGARRVYITSIFTQSALAIVILVLTETIGLWYMYNKMVVPDDRFFAAVYIFHISVLSMIVNIMSVPFSGAVMAHEKMDYYAYVSIFDVLMKLAIALILPHIAADKLILYGVFILCVSIINWLLYASYARIKFDEIRFKFVLYKDLFKNLLSFSGWNIFGKVAIMMKEQGVNMVLNLFFGPVVNAARGIAFQVNAALQGFISNINIAVKPQMTQAYAIGNKKRTFDLMFSISKLCYIILLLLAVPVCFEIDFILQLWLGENVPEYTNIFVVLVIMTSFVNNLNAPVSFVVHATGVMNKYQIVTSAIELLILPVTYFSLQAGGEPWIVFVVAFLFVMISQGISLVILKQIEDYSIWQYVYQVIFPLLIVTGLSLLVGYVIHMFIEAGFLRTIMVTASSALTILSIGYLVVLTNTERSIIKSYLKKKPRVEMT